MYGFNFFIIFTFFLKQENIQIYCSYTKGNPRLDLAVTEEKRLSHSTLDTWYGLQVGCAVDGYVLWYKADQVLGSTVV